MLRSGDLQFSSEVFAARFLSGDFTTLSQDGPWVLTVLGDIAGKGIAAGMWFTHLAGLLQSYGRLDYSPSRMAAEINRQLCYLRPVAPFVTAFFALTNCELGTLTYCNAGHFLPILLHADGPEPPFGVARALVAYSDGVLECRNPADEEFGVDRLIAALRQVKQQSAHDTLMMLLAAVQDFANGHPLCDDLSLSVIQRAGKNGTGRSPMKHELWDGRKSRSHL